MPSPFPGMNPYLERETVWSDFHVGFCNALKTALVPQVKPEYYFKFNEHLYVHEIEDNGRRLIGLADVPITRIVKNTDSSGGVGLLEAPVKVRMPEVLEETRVPFLEVYDKEDKTLVTVIELLSPSNKQFGKDRNQFLDKRLQILNSAVHYVEIDLLRGGPRLPIAEMPDCDYYVLVSRSEDRPEMGLWPLTLRQSLPVIPIPFSPSRPDARVDLQVLLHQVYDEAGYADYIYSGPPKPQLRADDIEWAKQFCPPTSA
jgi:hypothetical protein